MDNHHNHYGPNEEPDDSGANNQAKCTAAYSIFSTVLHFTCWVQSVSWLSEGQTSVPLLPWRGALALRSSRRGSSRRDRDTVVPLLKNSLSSRVSTKMVTNGFFFLDLIRKLHCLAVIPTHHGHQCRHSFIRVIKRMQQQSAQSNGPSSSQCG